MNHLNLTQCVASMVPNCKACFETVYTSWKIDDIAKYTNFSNNQDRKIKFSSCDGEDNANLTNVGLIDIQSSFNTQGFLLGYLNGNLVANNADRLQRNVIKGSALSHDRNVQPHWLQASLPPSGYIKSYVFPFFTSNSIRLIDWLIDWLHDWIITNIVAILLQNCSAI